jgi:hypothetical protein
VGKAVGEVVGKSVSRPSPCEPALGEAPAVGELEGLGVSITAAVGADEVVAGGDAVGADVGVLVGDAVGPSVGASVGLPGVAVGEAVGVAVGVSVSEVVAVRLPGVPVCDGVGNAVGNGVGDAVGKGDGEGVGLPGVPVGDDVRMPMSMSVLSPPPNPGSYWKNTTINRVVSRQFAL